MTTFLTTVLISALVFCLALLAMGVGVLLGREPIRGSCGGIMGGCGACTRRCEKKRAEPALAVEETT